MSQKQHQQKKKKDNTSAQLTTSLKSSNNNNNNKPLTQSVKTVEGAAVGLDSQPRFLTSGDFYDPENNFFKAELDGTHHIIRVPAPKKPGEIDVVFRLNSDVNGTYHENIIQKLIAEQFEEAGIEWIIARKYHYPPEKFPVDYKDAIKLQRKKKNIKIKLAEIPRAKS